MNNLNKEDQYPELLSDVAQQVETKLASLKAVPPEDAKRIGWEIAEHVRNHFAGELIYIPKGRAFEASQLHQQIWDEFNGHNVPDLVSKFGLAEQSIYRVLKFMRARSVRKNQLSLI